MTDQKQGMDSRLRGNDRVRTGFLLRATAPLAWAESAGGVRPLVEGSRTYHVRFSLPADPMFVAGHLTSLAHSKALPGLVSVVAGTPSRRSVRWISSLLCIDDVLCGNIDV
jgi:hypothetical protein